MAAKKTNVANKGASRKYIILGVVAVGLIITGGAIMFGKSDTGQINVSQVINESNVSRSQSGEEFTPTPVTNQQNTLPNGGLVGAGKSPEPEVATPEVEGASTTDAVASSTEEILEETEDNTDEVSEEESSEEVISEEVIEENNGEGQ